MNTYAIATLKNRKKIVIPATKEGKPDRVAIDKSIQRELAQLKQQEARRQRHEGRHALESGEVEQREWMESEALESAFSPDIKGETMPQNPGGFGFSLSALIGGAK